MKKSWKKIGIIGGAGPEASCLLYKEMISQCQKNYGCVDDKDFPEIVVLNYPFSNMVSREQAIWYEQDIKNELLFCLKKLNDYPCDVIGIACNTLHTFLDDSTSSFPVMRIDDIVAKHVVKDGIKKVLVLGTPTTAYGDLYAQHDDIDFIVPDAAEQAIVTDVINRILMGIIDKGDALLLQNVIKQQQAQECIGAVLLGCTELPVLNAQFPCGIEGVTVLDTVHLLAMSLLRVAQASEACA